MCLISKHERAQTFVVDATLFLDLAPAGYSDDLRDTVDYGAIAKGIVAIIEAIMSISSKNWPIALPA